MARSKIAQKGIFGFCWKHCGWTSLQCASADLILCGRPVNDWHVRCWCGLRKVENAGESSPYLEI